MPTRYIKKIQSHNYIFGNVFTLFEFSVCTAIALSIGKYFLVKSEWVFVFIVIGVICNFIPFMLFSFISLLKKEKSIGIFHYRDKDNRVSLAKLYANIEKDAFVLDLIVFIPFYLLVCILIELYGKLII